MTDLAIEFPEILADIEARAQRLIDDYDDHVGHRIHADSVESIAEHFLGYQIDITDEGCLRTPATSAVSCSTRT